MKTFRCGDVVPGCTRSFSGLEKDILAQVAEHARHDHGVSDLSAELTGRITRAMVLVPA